MLSERDWVMRLVKQLVELIARALKLGGEAKREEALTVLREGCAGLLGMEYEVLSMVDAHTAVELLGDPDRAVAFARLVDAMAQVESRCGEKLRAEARQRHADELTTVLEERWPTHREVRAFLQERTGRTSP